MRIERLALRFAPRPWAFAQARRAEIDAYFETLKAKNAHLWNGQVLLLHEHKVEGAVFSGAYLQTDFASFIAWRDWGFPDKTIRNCFAPGVIRAADGAFLLGVMGESTANAGRIYFYDALATKHTQASAFSVDGLTQLPRVDIFYAYANVGREYIDQCVALGCKGIVLAGVGDGNATKTAVEGLTDAIKKGVAVVRSSRTNAGITDRNVELNDDELGTVASMELNPGKARVLLQLALLKTQDAKKIQTYYDRY